MEVYVLNYHNFGYDGDYAECLGVFKDLKKAQNKMAKDIQDNIDNFDYVEDIETKDYENNKRLFYNCQENWNNYLEYSIEKMKIE